MFTIAQDSWNGIVVTKIQKRVISRKNLPSRVPVFQMMTVYLMLDKFDAPGWLWGVIGTFMVVALIGSLIEMHKENEVEVL